MKWFQRIFRGRSRTVADPGENFFQIARGAGRSESQITQERRLFSAANPFFARGDTWTRERDGARLAGFRHPQFVIDGEPVVFFGFWDSPDALSPSASLFAEFEHWARAHGARHAFGPIQFSILGDYRLQLDHFGETALPGEPRNPAYYPEILAKLGYRTIRNYQSYRSRKPPEIREWIANIPGSERFEQAGDYRACALTVAYWRARKRELRVALNDIFRDSFGFFGMSMAELEIHMGETAILRASPETSFVIESRRGSIAGICVCYQMNFGGSRELAVKTVGVRSRYAKQGVSLVRILRELADRAQGYDGIWMCLMQESNFPSLLMKEFADETRNYGLFGKKFDSESVTKVSNDPSISQK